MYSGTTITRRAGRIMGTHQKIDRVARRKLQPHIPSTLHFPTAKEILKFEGLNGPDGIKRKYPKRDEPWHYIDPANPDDRQILDLIQGHENNLIQALKDGNRERAAFEAAWLAHAVTDGLTPAHHYPYRENLVEMLGDDIDAQETVAKKILKSGDTWREKLLNNYEYYKPNGKGLGSAHLYFELGVAMTTAPLRFTDVKLSRNDRARVQTAGGIVPFYLDIVKKVYRLGMYDEFLRTSWTLALTRQAKNELMPTIIHTVLMSWYYCVWRASQKDAQ
jgi:hypothetical protein